MGEVIQTEAFSPMAVAGALSSASTKQDITSVLMRAVRTGVEEPVLTDLLREIKRQSGWSIGSLRALLKGVASATTADPGEGINGENDGGYADAPRADCGASESLIPIDGQL